MNGNKDVSISIRLRKEEYLWIDSAARSEDLSISGFLRRILIKHLNEEYPKMNPEVIFKPTRNVTSKVK
jgi:hypothetical protein